MTEPSRTGSGDAGAGRDVRTAAAWRACVESDRLMGVVDVPLGQWHPRRQSTAPTAPIQLPYPTTATQAERLAELRDRHDRECMHCTTATAHQRTVFGEGDPSARLMFVGEAPGETEDELGRPFVGRAGRKLDEMIQAIGLRREDCYIANVLKSRPPNNRAPLPLEIERCSPYLVEQLLIIQPRVIMTLGGPATKMLLKTDVGIVKLRGGWSEWVAPVGSPVRSIALMPTFHPAYLLRNYTLETRAQVWSDLKAVMQRLSECA